MLEHDEEWIRFFKQGFPHLSEHSRIVHLPLLYTKIGQEEFPLYDGFQEFIQSTGRKFQLISVDGPCGTHSDVYCRRDILGCLPDLLADDFVIMFDDVGSYACQTTPRDAEKMLRDAGIPFVSSVYSGVKWKKVHVIASESWRFLTTL